MRNLTPAYLIHARSFRETSLLLDFFTQEHGFIKAVAQGVKSAKNNKRGLLQPFNKLLINWRGRSELVTLNNVESLDVYTSFQGNKLAVGLYINELLYNLCGKTPGVQYENLFFYLEALLKKLSEFNLTQASIQKFECDLREFELELLSAIGYGIEFNDIDKNNIYGYDLVSGFFIASNEYQAKRLILSGNVLIKIAKKTWDSDSLLAAKKLLREILQYHLGKKELQSRKLLVF